MARVEKTVFISYRRTNFYMAQAIYQDLTFHGYDVFFDYLSIASGDFERIIIENIRARAHFLIVLTPSALERLAEPRDWLRREIEAALASQRNIVPLMFEGFDFGTPSVVQQLVGRLEPLRHYNGLSVPAEYFAAAMDKLRTQYLSVALDAVLHPISVPARDAVATQRAAADAAAAVQEVDLTAVQWFERGTQAVSPEERIRCFTNAIILRPDYSYAYFSRGMARDAVGDLDGALADYNSTLQLNPSFASAYVIRGTFRKERGDVDGALADYDQAVRVDPDDESAFYMRAIARRARDDLDGALADFDRAVQLNPQGEAAYLNRALARMKKGDLAGALTDSDAVVRLTPEDPTGYLNRAVIRAAAGDLKGALADYNEGIRLKPDDASAYLDRAELRATQGDVDGALADYNVAIRLNPDNAAAYYDRASVFRARNDVSQAIEDYEKYLQLGGGVRQGNTKAVQRLIRDLRKQL